MLTADLRRYYGLDLRDLFRPGSTLTARHVLTLAEHLPEDSALFADMRGGKEFRAWTTERYLQAAMVNLLNAANHQRARKRAKALVKPPVKRRSQERRVMRVSQLAGRAAASLHRMAA